MSAEIRFGTSLFGFKKSDVHYYLEKNLKDLEDKFKAKDEEIASLKNQNKEFKLKNEEMIRKNEQINEDRAKIADVLIKAQEKAGIMIEEARIQALEEKKSLEKIIEDEKEKLVDIKGDIKLLKSEVVSLLKKYENQLTEIVEE